MKQKKESFFSKHTPYAGERFNKFGLKDLIEMMVSLAWSTSSFGWGSSDAREKLAEKMHRFFSSFETDLRTIRKNQKFFEHFINDKKLINFLLKTRYPSFPDGRRNDYASSSAENDAMAVTTISFLKDLNTLIKNGVQYAPLRSRLRDIEKQNPWLKQVEQMTKNSSRYSHYMMKTELELTVNYSNKDEKRFDINSNSYSINFLSKNNSMPVYNRMDGRFYMRFEKPEGKGAKKTKQYQVNSIDINQKLDGLTDECWEKLIRKIVLEHTAKELWRFKEGQTATMAITVKVNAKGKTTATVILEGGEQLKLEYVSKGPDIQHHYEWKTWVYSGEKYIAGKESATDGILEKLIVLRNSQMFVGSRSYLYSYVDNFKSFFSKMDELIYLAVIANFYNSQQGKWVFPTMLPMQAGQTNIVAGINPLLFSKKLVPVANDVVFTKRKNGFLITGANTGGKTAYTNMLALNQMLAQAGLPVFAESARLSVKDKILCHYVESEDIGVNLSRYQSELRRLGGIVDKVTSNSMVLFDEPFSGTSVEAGTSQAHHVLRMLSKVGCVFIMNTHFHQLIELVGKNGTSSVTNLHFVLPEPEKPKATDYKVLPGGIKISEGEAIALIEKVDYRSMMIQLRKRKIPLRSV